MLLAQISDTHFRSRGQKLYGFIDVNAANADVVSQLNALQERPDAAISSTAAARKSMRSPARSSAA